MNFFLASGWDFLCYMFWLLLCVLLCADDRRPAWLILVPLLAGCRKHLGLPSVDQAEERQFLHMTTWFLLALCWTPSHCFVFLLRALSVCKSQTDCSWEFMSADRKGIMAPLDRCVHCGNVRVVVVFTCVLQPHTCFKLTEALLPSPVFNYPPTSFPLLCWLLLFCSPVASQKQSRSSSWVGTDQCILSDHFFFFQRTLQSLELTQGKWMRGGQDCSIHLLLLFAL